MKLYVGITDYDWYSLDLRPSSNLAEDPQLLNAAVSDLRDPQSIRVNQF